MTIKIHYCVVVEGSGEYQELKSMLLKSGVGYPEVPHFTTLQDVPEQDPSEDQKRVILYFLPPGEHNLGNLESLKSDAVCLAILTHAQAELGPAILAAGADDYLIKGMFDAAFLNKSIQFALERSSHQNMAQMEAAFRLSHSAILVADDQGNYLNANAAAAEMLGYSVSELKTLNIADLVYAQEEVLGLFRQFLEEQKEEGVIVLRKKDGSGIWARYKAVANILPGMHLSVLNDATRDISDLERQKLLAEMAQANSASESLEQAVPSLLKALTENMRWTGAELWWVHESQDHLYLKGSFYDSADQGLKVLKEQSPGVNVPVEGNVLVKRISQADKPFFIPDIAGSGQFLRQAWFPESIPYFAVITPIWKDDQLLGCLFGFGNVKVTSEAEQRLRMPVLAEVAPLVGREVRKVQMRSELNHVISSTNDLMAVVDFHKRLVRVNPAFERTLGYSFEELRTKTFRDLIAAEQYEHARQLLDKAIEGQSMNFEDVLMLSASGEEKWIEFSLTPNPATAGVYFIGRDVTEHKRVKEQLLRANQRYQLALKATHLGIWELNLHSKQMFLDSGVCHIYELPQKESTITRGRWKEFLHPEDAERVLEAFEKSAQRGEPLNLQYRIVTDSGMEKYVKVSAEVLKDDQGKTEGMVGISLDVTDYMLSEMEKAHTAAILKERVKEQKCLYRIARLQQEELSLEEILSRAAEILPEAFQHPELAVASIEWAAKTYRTKTFTKTPTSLSVERPGPARDSLRIEVYYKKRGYGREQPAFMKEERELLTSVADQLFTGIELTLSKKRLMKNEARFRNLFEHSYDVILIINDQGRVKYISPSCVNLSGHLPEEVLGSFSVSYVHPDDRPEREQMLKTVLDGHQQVVTFKERMQRKDGEYIWVYVSLSDQREVPGVEGLVFNVRNIHQEEQARQELEQSEARLDRTQKMARIGYWWFDLKSFELRWGREVYDLYGLQPDSFELNFSSFLQYVYPEDRHMFSAENFRLLEDNNTDEIEYRVLNSRGEVRWFRGVSNLVSTDDGQAGIVEGAVQDITERKVAQLELEEREKRLRLFMDNSPALTWLKSAKGRVLAANDKFLTATGRTTADIGKMPSSVIEVAPDTRLNDLKVLKAGKGMRFVEEVRDAKGEMRIYEVYKFPVGKGPEAMLGGFALDITEKKKHLQAIKEQNEKLRTIAWIQSHVVRAPLARLMGLMEVFGQEGITPQERQMIIDQLQVSAHELDEVIHEMVATASDIKFNLADDKAADIGG